MSRIALGVSGGIAAYKACELLRLLLQRGHQVRVVCTPNALRFVSGLTLQTLSGFPVRSELFSPTEESEISHIELADWAEAVVIAPATASVIARVNSSTFRRAISHPHRAGRRSPTSFP